MTKALGHARNDTIDVFRAIAILSVMLHHYSAWSPITGWTGGGALPALQIGRFGVQLFFVVSGLVIAMTLQKTSTFGGFVLKRFARIYPAYLVAMIVTVVAERCLDQSQAFRISAFAIFTNLSPYGIRHPLVDPSYWSLTVEIQFYVIAAILQQLLGLRLWIGMSLITLAGALVAWQAPGFASQHMLLAYLPLFLIGVSCWAFAYEHDRRALLGFLIAALCYIPDSPLLIIGPHLFSPWQMHVYIIGLTALLIGLICFKVRFAPPGLAWIGRVSYSLYLIHQVIGVSLIGTLRAQGVPTGVAVVGVFVAMIGLAGVMFRFVEEPGREWVLARAKQLKARLHRSSVTSQVAGERSQG